MSFLKIAENYDAFLCDLWGVIHDGDNLYPNVLESLEALHDMGKDVLFLSNAPRLAESIFTRMDTMGVKREWYKGGMTSGEAAIKHMQNLYEMKEGGQQADSALSVSEANSPSSSPVGRAGAIKYYYLGLEKDEPMLDDMPQQRVDNIADADLLLNGNFEALGDTMPDVMPYLEQAIAKKLPMLCINPDMEVTKLDGTQILCAGYIAQEYKKIGGTVEYVGKPYPFIYELGMELLGNPPKDKVLMIGDNVMTDIKGGNAFGIDTVFITQGILQNQKGDETPLEYCQARGIIPTHITTSL